LHHPVSHEWSSPPLHSPPPRPPSPNRQARHRPPPSPHPPPLPRPHHQHRPPRRSKCRRWRRPGSRPVPGRPQGAILVVTWPMGCNE
jgi:hypothetical protein